MNDDTPDRTMRFDYLRSTKPAVETQRMLIFHWTGGINGARAIFNTLKQRGLSIHYTVDSAGVTYQHASLDLTCLHASAANKFSIGVECASPGFPGSLAEMERKRGVEREEYECVIRGKPHKCLTFTRTQLASMIALADQVCALKAIPRVIPKDPTREFTPHEFATYRGVAGHCHMPGTTKLDPGMQLFEALKRHGYANAE